jgi:hypothetical protein
MPSATKLPPLPETAFEGIKESHTIEYPKCKHSKDKLKIVDGNTLRCACGAGWTGGNILKLYELLTK